MFIIYADVVHNPTKSHFSQDRKRRCNLHTPLLPASSHTVTMWQSFVLNRQGPLHFGQLHSVFCSHQGPRSSLRSSTVAVTLSEPRREARDFWCLPPVWNLRAASFSDPTFLYLLSCSCAGATYERSILVGGICSICYHMALYIVLLICDCFCPSFFIYIF